MGFYPAQIRVFRTCINCGRRNIDLTVCLPCQYSLYYAVDLTSLNFPVFLPVLIKLTMSEVISSEAYLDMCTSHCSPEGFLLLPFDHSDPSHLSPCFELQGSKAS